MKSALNGSFFYSHKWQLVGAELIQFCLVNISYAVTFALHIAK